MQEAGVGKAGLELDLEGRRGQVEGKGGGQELKGRGDGVRVGVVVVVSVSVSVFGVSLTMRVVCVVW